MKLIFIDFETYSDVDITLGAHAYTHGKDFRAVSLAYAIDGGRICTTTDFSKIPADIARAMAGDHTFIAHNVGFDKAVFERTYRTRKITSYFDTKAMCSYYSIPAKLKHAPGFLGLGEQKGEPAKATWTKHLKGETLNKEELKDLLVYNKQDTKVLRDLYRTFTKLRSMDPFSVKVLKLHDDMNASGIAVNQERARKLLSVILKEKARIEIHARKKFGAYGKDGKAVATSADQVKKYLNRKGFPIESIAEKELEDFLSVSGSKLPRDCRELISCFRELQSRGADKLRLIVENNLSRIYGSSTYHGTHTGRPSGSGINLLNVKRITDGDDEKPFEKSLKRIVKTAKQGEKVKRLSSLLWGCLEPDKNHGLDETIKDPIVLVRSDLSAIEPRVGAWLRNDHTVLDIYRAADAGTGKDEYTIFGESMNFPKAIARNLSKIVILAACYGMGPERLRMQIRSWGMPDPGEDEAEKILAGYHRRNPSVKRIWFDLIKKTVSVIENEERILTNHVEMFAEEINRKVFLCVKLPSGRVKRYADVRIEANAKGWKTFSYIDPLKRIRTRVPAASLYENLVQAIAVDVSFEKALVIQKFSKVKLIIHDELNVSTLPRHLDRIKKVMKSPVQWLPGMPVSSKTVLCSSFHKGDVV